MNNTNEKIIYASPDPKGIYLYTPALIEGFDGRLVAAVDLGGPGTDKLTGPRSTLGDYRTGNQVRVLVSDDKGETWTETPARLPMMHEILFKAGNALYMVAHSGILLATKSLDNGITWSEPSVLVNQPRWHQSCANVDIHDGRITLVYEKWISDGHPWPGVAPVLMSASVDDDLTKPESWTFSEPFNPDPLLEASRQSGIPIVKDPGVLETATVRIHDPRHPLYDPTGQSVALLMRTHSGFTDMGAILKGTRNPDGSLQISQYKMGTGNLFFIHIPGANIKFHIQYDPATKLYWMLHSHIGGMVAERQQLALSYTPDLFRWNLATIVATGPKANAARHYATGMIFGDDYLVLSRSGDEFAKNAHDNNLTTFHNVKDFRQLVNKELDQP
ncbi:MAG: exo-alpha-sialidase [Lentisphaerae bacterium]|jgi:hypothetical protein|nr:exo-alpha-sialidase [Lentisphaerota bacterium]